MSKMPDFLETHVSVVQKWECDSNDHLNIQFFHQRFREAGHHFRLLHGLRSPALRRAHTRFHRELLLDDRGHVRTLPVRDGRGAVFLLHELIRSEDGVLSSTSLEPLPDAPADLAAAPAEEFGHALPRGLPEGPAERLGDAAALVADGRALTSCVTVAEPSHLDHAGHLRAERVVGSFACGGQSSWSLIGATSEALRERGLGRVALELKLAILADPRPGTVLRQTTGCLSFGTKTLHFGHQIEDAVTGRLHATGRVIGVLLDHATRRSVTIPPELTGNARLVPEG